MDQQPARGNVKRHPTLGPVLLLFCGGVALYLVSVSHFVVSCLGQIGQAVETMRRAYLPEAVRQQQDAANAERLHRFAAVVRHTTDPETRRQAALHVRVMHLNASVSRAAGARVRLGLASRLVEDLARLRQREDDLVAAWHGQVGQLYRFQAQLAPGPDLDGIRETVTQLLAEAPPWGAPPARNDSALAKIPEDMPRWLQEVQDTRQEARLVAADVRAIWERCDVVLGSLADSIGADACISLDGLIVDLVQQVYDLQQIASWLLVLTSGVLVAFAVFFYRHVVRPVFLFAQAVRSGKQSRLSIPSHFRELHDIGEALRGPTVDNEPPRAGEEKDT